MKTNIPFINRLDERGLIDRWGFVAFAAVGSVAIVAAKHYGAEGHYVAIGAVLLLFAYAALVNFGGTGKLRSDQAGDNCYYLGLVYTLASLSYAIFTFDPANTATTIVQGFGIALATTIAGLVLRVFFNQSRVDLYEAEDTARLELAQAAARLKTELSQIALSFSDFGHQTKQIISELRQAAVDSIEEATQNSARAISDIAESATNVFDVQSKELGAEARRLSAVTGKVTASMEQHAGSIDSMMNANNVVAERVNLIGEAASSANTSTERLAASAATALQTHSAINNSAQALSENTQRIQAALVSVEASLSRLHGDMAGRLQQLEDGPKAVMEGALQAIAAASDRLTRDVDGLAGAHRQAASDISSETAGVLRALRGHNEAMETELTTSRTNVSKVHAALVDMTGELVQQVASRAS